MAVHQSISSNPRVVDLTGESFGRWTAVRYVGHSQWWCHCECGTERAVNTSDLRAGKSVSCGCYAIEVRSARLLRHGASNHFGRSLLNSTYNIWSDMRRRCRDPKRKRYEDYGGRGIAVCKRWQDGDGAYSGFECFLVDVGERPSWQHSLERQNNDGDYTPTNCSWSLRGPQSRNKRTSRMVTFRGKRMNITDAIAAAGFAGPVVFNRLRRGWPLERALNEPLTYRPTRKWASKHFFAHLPPGPERDRAVQRESRRMQRAAAKAEGRVRPGDDWAARNPDRHRANGRKWRSANLERARELARNNQATRRSTPWGQINNRIWTVMHGCVQRNSANQSKYTDALGYLWSELRIHLEAQFTSGMTWDNWGAVWELDHIEPLAGFRYLTVDDPLFREAWALSNLRPLARSANASKGKRPL